MSPAAAKRPRSDLHDPEAEALQEFALEEVAPPNTHVYVSEPSTSLVCPICREVLRDACTMLACQHVFCRECIKEALNRKRECPCCRKKPAAAGRWENLIAKNLLVNSIVGEMKVHCRFGLSKGPDGSWQTQGGQNWCPKILPLDEVPSHEKQCEFARIQCPMQGCKAVLMRRDMPRHLEENLGKHMEMLQAEFAGRDAAIKCSALQLEQTQIKLDMVQTQLANVTGVVRDFFSRKKRRLRAKVHDRKYSAIAGLLAKEYKELKCDIGLLDKALDELPGHECPECTAEGPEEGGHGQEGLRDSDGEDASDHSGSSDSEEDEEEEDDDLLPRAPGGVIPRISTPMDFRSARTSLPGVPDTSARNRLFTRLGSTRSPAARRIVRGATRVVVAEYSEEDDSRHDDESEEEEEEDDDDDDSSDESEDDEDNQH